MQIVCGAGNMVAIDNVKINNAAAAGMCPIAFTDGVNALILFNGSSLTAGSDQPAVKVPHPASLIFDGPGLLFAIGGENGAGIGGTGSMTVGTIVVYQAEIIIAEGGSNAPGIGGGALAEIAPIIIHDGYVIATGGSGGAGIGGSTNSGVSAINIIGGTVEAYGGDGGAGIGGGELTVTASVIIEGGEIYAKGGAGASGIGGGVQSVVSSIEITGGIVEAYGETGGAGIGGGLQGTCGTITISGGTVFAKKKDGDDIGNGLLGSGAALTINSADGNPAVFAANDDFCTVSTATHTHYSSLPVYGGKLHGVIIPATWTMAGAYIIPINVGYDPNGGIGPAAHATQHIGTTGTISDGSHLSHATKTFDKWNTQSDGGGTDYAPGSAHVYNTSLSLYAIYKTPVTSVDVSPNTATIRVGDTPTLAVTVNPNDATYSTVLWESSDDAIATVNQSGVVTGIAPGSVTITATADGVSDSCAVTVEAAVDDSPFIKGALYDPVGGPLVGWTVVLESTPITVVTDTLGVFRFANTTFENHTLTIKDKGGFVTDVFLIEFTKGDTFEWNETGGIIYITVPPNTRGFDIQIMVGDEDPTVIESISIFIGNPDTGGTADYTWLWTALTAVLLLAAVAVTLKKLSNR